MPSTTSTAGYARSETVIGRNLAYGLAIILPLLTAEFRLAAGDWLGNSPNIKLFTVAIILAAYCGGLGPGLLATGVSVAAVLSYLLPSRANFFPVDSISLLQLTILAAEGVLISYLCGKLQRQYVTIQQAIAARRHAETVLSEREMLLQTMVENMSEGLFLAELDGRIIHWNQLGLQMHGFKSLAEGRGEFVELDPIFELFTIDGRPIPVGEWPVARILRDEVLRDCEVRVRRPNQGWERVYSYSGEIVRDRGRRQLALVKVIDITARHAAVAAMRGANVELELRVAQRTAELETANKELEAFSYSVSHDLRSPLRAVDGFSQALLEDFGTELPAEGRRYLQSIREGAQRMGALIDDLLNFSRLSRQSLQKQTIATTQLVRTAWDELDREGRPVDFLLEELPPCQGDPALLKQVWLNLLSNALKYSAQRQPALITVGTVAHEAGRAYFVRDNGAGFDMRYAHKLFGVFQRLHTNSEYPGTGVGLAIVQRIIHRHGGRIWAEAAPEQGATFYFTL